ncbi:MAG TPA: helix-turn-helix domain-containing protein [Chitinophagales bacterium]|nr:helix-turn-helix domain-containing protein [Chitinophagales bacterium]
MELKIIKNEKDYQKALNRVDALFDMKPKKTSALGNELEVLLLLIKKYEDEHYAIPLPDAIETIRLTIEEKHLKQKDLEKYIGSKSYVSSILNHRKPLTLEIARKLNKHLGIPAQVLLG